MRHIYDQNLYICLCYWIISLGELFSYVYSDICYNDEFLLMCVFITGAGYEYFLNSNVDRVYVVKLKNMLWCNMYFLSFFYQTVDRWSSWKIYLKVFFNYFYSCFHIAWKFITLQDDREDTEFICISCLNFLCWVCNIYGSCCLNCLFYYIRELIN